MEKGLRRKTPIILRMALLACVARRGTSVGGARALLAVAEAEPENSMTKQSDETVSPSDLKWSGLWMVAEEGRGRGEGEAVGVVDGGGSSEFDASE